MIGPRPPGAALGGARPPFREPRRLACASLFEGTTLVLLVLVAVPLKHLAGLPVAVRVMGPVHGLAFAFYAWSVVEALSAGGWNGRDAARLVGAALVPFGAFANLGWLRRRAARGGSAA